MKRLAQTTKVLTCASLLLFALGGCSNVTVSSDLAEEVWPDFVPKPEWHELAKVAASEYIEQGQTYSRNIVDTYTTEGSYLNFGRTINYKDIPDLIKLDNEGIPLHSYDKGETYHYNPVLVAQHALSLHGKYLEGELSAEAFLNVTHKLTELQRADGGLAYDFEHTFYLREEPFEPGWTSGMAQGQALSVYARAYIITQDASWLEIGNSALEHMLTPVGEGGTLGTLAYLHPSLEHRLTIEEYPAEPHNYVLNGFMFALLGLYDWAAVQPDSRAGSVFSNAVESLVLMLPYYDIGGMSTYDLGQVIFDHTPYFRTSYHRIHIYLLHALHSITGDYRLAHFERSWIAYITPKN